jgi:hypothetical protein
VARDETTSTPTSRVVGEHTPTRDVRDIAVVGERVIVATSEGIAVHRWGDGRFLFELTSLWHGTESGLVAFEINPPLR